MGKQNTTHNKIFYLCNVSLFVHVSVNFYNFPLIANRLTELSSMKVIYIDSYLNAGERFLNLDR